MIGWVLGVALGAPVQDHPLLEDLVLPPDVVIRIEEGSASWTLVVGTRRTTLAVPRTDAEIANARALIMSLVSEPTPSPSLQRALARARRLVAASEPEEASVSARAVRLPAASTVPATVIPGAPEAASGVPGAAEVPVAAVVATSGTHPGSADPPPLDLLTQDLDEILDAPRAVATPTGIRSPPPADASPPAGVTEADAGFLWFGVEGVARPELALGPGAVFGWALGNQRGIGARIAIRPGRVTRYAVDTRCVEGQVGVEGWIRPLDWLHLAVGPGLALRQYGQGGRAVATHAMPQGIVGAWIPVATRVGEISLGGAAEVDLGVTWIGTQDLGPLPLTTLRGEIRLAPGR